jgi:hypothetical protein
MESLSARVTPARCFPPNACLSRVELANGEIQWGLPGDDGISGCPAEIFLKLKFVTADRIDWSPKFGPAPEKVI